MSAEHILMSLTNLTILVLTRQITPVHTHPKVWMYIVSGQWIYLTFKLTSTGNLALFAMLCQ